MNNENHGQETHSAKWGLIFGRKYPKYSKICSFDLLNWPKSLGYHWKKASLGVRSPCRPTSFASKQYCISISSRLGVVVDRPFQTRWKTFCCIVHQSKAYCLLWTNLKPFCSFRKALSTEVHKQKFVSILQWEKIKRFHLVQLLFGKSY